MTDEAIEPTITDIRRDLDGVNERFRQLVGLIPAQNGRHPVQIEVLESYLQEYRRAMRDDYVTDYPTIELENIEVPGYFRFPVGIYPGIRITNCFFKNGVIFTNSRFKGAFKFVGDNGKVIMSFDGVLFEKETEFRSGGGLNVELIGQTKLCEDTQIVGAKKLAVDSAEFHGRVLMQNVENLVLTSVEFQQKVEVRGRESYCTLKDVAFQKEVEFTGSFEDSQFEDVRFHRSANFKMVKTSGAICLRRSRFWGDAIFDNSSFGGPMFFERCLFWSPPTFYGSTVFPNSSCRTSKFGRCHTIEDANAYRQLRQNFPSEDGKFFAYEQRSLSKAMRRARKGFSLPGWISKFYDLFSEYGESVFRPLMWLVATNVATWWVFSKTELCQKIYVTSGMSAWATELNAPLGIVVQNVFHPFAMFGKQSAYTTSSGWVVFISAIQSVLTILFTTLVFLAVRRKFRKGSE